MKDSNEPATKADLASLEVGIDTKLEGLKNRLDTKLEDVKDQIIRAFQMTEENIRGDCAHADEVREVENRVTRIEQSLGIDKH